MKLSHLRHFSSVCSDLHECGWRSRSTAALMYYAMGILYPDNLTIHTHMQSISLLCAHVDKFAYPTKHMITFAIKSVLYIICTG